MNTSFPLKRLTVAVAFVALASSTVSDFAFAQQDKQPVGGAGNSVPEKLGTVRFPTSCSPASQQQFEHAVALLHSFYYPNNLKEFTAITENDPQCAIAYWGVAISQRPNPLVGPWDNATLKRGLDATQKGLAIALKTDRERDWLAAMELFFKDYEKTSQDARTLAYEKAMGELTQKYPDDTEAAIFYALALNETASHNDKTYSNQLKAAAILQKVEAIQPDHPGIIHYLIHSYDYTPIAQKGLPYANKYAQVAPAAPHAQHMPSHLYSMLGMWSDSVKSNQAAIDVMTGIIAKSGTGMTHQGAPHSWDFMAYAYLQTGQNQKAKQIVDETNAAQKFPIEPLTVYTALAAVPARYALERGDWKEAAALEPRGSKYAQAEAITWFARAVGSARSGNTAGIKPAIDKLKELRATLEKANQAYWAEQVEVQILAASAWAAHAQGNKTEARKLMRAAADLEDASEKHVAMENRLYPMREMLGDMLLEDNNPKLALKEYEATFSSSPARLRGLYGAAKAAEMAKDKRKAAMYYGMLVEQTKHADSDRMEIKQAKTYAMKN